MSEPAKEVHDRVRDLAQEMLDKHGLMIGPVTIRWDCIQLTTGKWLNRIVDVTITTNTNDE
jgi:hypothetical protein